VGVAAVSKFGALGEGAAPSARAEPWSATHPLPNAGPQSSLPRARAGVHVGESALRDRYQYLSAVDRRSLMAVEDSRPRRPAARMDACPPPCPTGYAPVHHPFVDFNTVGGDLIGTTRWSGVSLQQLLPELG
jgi:hypothetical protein